MLSRFTHVDENDRPQMVDVGHKAITHRRAKAEGRVHFPPELADRLRSQGYNTAKGPVFQTAIVAGVQAVKRTHELIPLCHLLPINGCSIDIQMDGDDAVIRCSVNVHDKTGVEMEALTGASVAALTVYDMCKALSHDLVIGGIRLIEKRGGKSAWKDFGPARYIP